MTSNLLPFISIIIPVRNEGKYIGGCLDSLMASTYPLERPEILVADGCSTDNTLTLLGEYQKKFPQLLRIINNPRKIVPPGLNLMIRESKGEFIARIDAHCIYPKDYLEILCNHMREHPEVANVGACCETVPGSDSKMAKAISIAISHPFGIGNAQFRIGGEKPRAVDTVPFGFFRKEVFVRHGYFDEDLVRNQDDEFNHRLVKNGETIILIPSLKVVYFARPTLPAIAKMYFQYGLFKPLCVKKLGGAVTLRQFVPLLFFASLFFCLALAAILSSGFWLLLAVAESSAYLLGSFLAATSALLKRQQSGTLLFHLMLAFASVHAAYAWGYLQGLWHFLICGKNRMGNDLSLTR